ncbi:hypothetical protein JNB_12209 [Janibacter sp. HTCC2649]|uniref:hypothetical protein n=1 Tax=Janibacter sp. HTCC2649 TaxID=313589 RepID=UPI0000670BF1|nr:hypothetical protein [Janibacter sp. HTCC2649]EAQ00939.1 hypothetical protein JNB_12209 [Janibacter sp. HTCC2649]
MRQFRTTLTLTVVISAALAGCGSEGRTTPPAASLSPSSSASPVADIDVDLSREVVAHGMLMQRSTTAPVEICVGGVNTSYPPQCGGPTFAGEFSWDGLKPERSRGITWTNASVWAVGRFDPKAGPTGTFTLTRPIAMTAPAGMTEPSSDGVDFPQLCKDPYAGGGSKGAGGSGADTNALTTLLPTLDGYVASYVSSLFNVLVTGDAAAAQREIRKVWKGGLCVEQRDGPTEAAINAAHEALGKRFKDLGLLSSGGSMGALEVEAVVVDAATRARILEIVKPWVTPDQVRISNSIRPLPQ